VVSVAERFGENVVRCRERAGLSQEAVARRADISRSRLGELERGIPIRPPRVDTLLRLAGALEVSPDELLEGIVWTPGRTEVGRFLDG
jgi:transcriptional regulator with XRE-family HTH domain